MGQESLVIEQINAGDEFARDFNNHVSVDVAFWINPVDSEGWVLYIASAEINDDNLKAAYGEVLQRVGNNKSQWLDAFQVKLLNSADPLAAKVIDIRNRYSQNSPTRYNGSSIAGMAIGGAYIYPPIAAPSSTP